MQAWQTHEVVNQSPTLDTYNLLTTDLVLQQAVARQGAGWALDSLQRIGDELGTPESFEAGRLANCHPPILRAFDTHGNRIDQVEFHPAWHRVLGDCVRRGLHTGPWADSRPGAHVARAAGFYLQAQVEAGSLCPTTMTYGAIPVLQRTPHAASWLPILLARGHDPRDLPIDDKHGALIGMGMTEKQGGSDVRANTTRAEPDGAGGFVLTGHKWFFSAPMCDAHLILGQAPQGLSCFFVPRWRPDGTRNAVHIQRLKDKVGNRSNASAEVELRGAWGMLAGDPGRGVATILEMATYTRLDCVLGTAGIMRQMLVQALHHAQHRRAFGKSLIDQPLMRNVLADLALESEAATALAMRMARAFDAQDDPSEKAFRRLVTPAAKYWVCKRGPTFAAEAMEVLGGNGYVEDGAAGRAYREMPVNSIWEGSGNVMCLDVLRALAREPAAIEVIQSELAAARGASSTYDQHLVRLQRELSNSDQREVRARRLTQHLTLGLQASLLIQHAPNPVSDAFCRSRLQGDWGQSFGTLPAGVDFEAIMMRSWSAK